MKKILLAAAVLLSTSAFGFSSQTVIHKVLPTVIQNGVKSDLVGVLAIDLMNQEIAVEIYHDICHTLVPQKPGTPQCKAMPILEQRLSVPLQTIEDAGCGSTLYKGKKDSRPVDGALVDLKVTDHSQRLCKDMVLGEIVVKAKVQAAHDRKATKYLMY